MSGHTGRRGGCRYPANRRLRTPRDFKTVFKRNVRSHDRYFTVLAHRTGAAAPRLGTAVSRKACGNAVKRNRLKRIIRESFRHAAGDLPGVDLVVIVKPGAGTIANPTLFTSLARHWQVISQKCAR